MLAGLGVVLLQGHHARSQGADASSQQELLDCRVGCSGATIALLGFVVCFLRIGWWFVEAGRSYVPGYL